jgi:hypothetical protein
MRDSKGKDFGVGAVCTAAAELRLGNVFKGQAEGVNRCIGQEKGGMYFSVRCGSMVLASAGDSSSQAIPADAQRAGNCAPKPGSSSSTPTKSAPVFSMH